jgi:Ca2+-binding RTX toxin-like protein
VDEVNMAPALELIGDKSINEQTTLSFAAMASDQDLLFQTLTFSLNAAAVALGMSINSTTGAFSWTPTEAQGGTEYSVTVKVTDNGTNPANLTNEKTFQIQVNNMSGAVVPIQDPQRGEWILQVFGTTGDDVIHVKPANNPNAVRVIINNVTQDYVVRGSTAPTIARFVVYGDAGNDVIQVSQHFDMLGIPAELRGGPGDDNIKGGAGPDMIFGEAGDDVLVGEEGRDLLVGGTGADRLVGNEEDDILISGTTDYDLNIVAMDTIFDEWRSVQRSYSERIANIRGGLSGGYFLSNDGANANIHDDGAADVLTGSHGLDWFVANFVLDAGDDATTKDKIKDLSDAEFADDLDFILNGI